jgi:hypothetical protein
MQAAIPYRPRHVRRSQEGDAVPEIVRCRACDRETYMGLAVCPHCGADMLTGLAADVAAAEATGSSRAVDTIGLFLVRLLIFNGAYWSTISAIEIYDRYAYGELAVPGGAHPAVALFILGGFVLLNLI